MMHDTTNLASLAYLYVEKNAEKGMSPEELYAMYNEALSKLQDLYAANRKR